MKSKNLVALALLAGMGVVLHTITPGIIMGMKPDMMLTMMFLGIILFPDKKSVLLMGLVTGLLSALTTTFPGGQFPNIIDKLVTAFIFFGLLMLLKKVPMQPLVCTILTGVGTIISGIIFLSSAYFIVGLPDAFLAMFALGVLPAAGFNIVLIIILYPIAQSISKRTKLNEQTIQS
ncbi:tryptophan transporter [Cytobacillus purgationiresistens]|uniref:Vacuolar-type H+-ATPase subunit I/STV1 n=1 Tax=Cytobacillus purgationiresistens TaxID=863449 RepID=A0ABU0AD15_9BACI|nr:tryptophan transporter [Cytobacillus purgationiresistens]MDQ0268935.1 vacuolar-type H+-ATPase subunit I/STV1 [Cytobacillus purgationiresistens]